MKRTSTSSPALPPAGTIGLGAGERADVQPVLARPVALVGALADLDDVGAVGGGDDRAHAVLAEQRVVVGGGQLEALAVEDGDVRVEQGVRPAASPSISTDSRWPFLQFDGEVIDVLVIDDAGDGDAQRDLLRRGEIAVGLLLGDHREGADPEGAQLAEAAGGAQADAVFAEQAVGGDLDRGVDLRVVDDFELGDREAGAVEDDFLGVVEAGAGEARRASRPPSGRRAG